MQLFLHVYLPCKLIITLLLQLVILYLCLQGKCTGNHQSKGKVGAEGYKVNWVWKCWLWKMSLPCCSYRETKIKPYKIKPHQSWGRTKDFATNKNIYSAIEWKMLHCDFLFLGQYRKTLEVTALWSKLNIFCPWWTFWRTTIYLFIYFLSLATQG